MSDNNRGEQRDSPDTNATINREIPGGEDHADWSVKPVISQQTQQTDPDTNEIQPYGMVINVPLALDHGTRETNVHNLNQLLADTMTLRDLYKKHHWQVTGPTFNQLHHLFDKHFHEQSELIDLLAERIQTLGGVALAMAHDVAEATTIPRAPRSREGVNAQLYRLVSAHEIILKESRTMAQHSTKNGDEGTSDILVSDVIRTNELQVWLLSQHLVQPEGSAEIDTSGFQQPGESRIHPEELKGWANESQNTRRGSS